MKHSKLCNKTRIRKPDHHLAPTYFQHLEHRPHFLSKRNNVSLLHQMIVDGSLFHLKDPQNKLSILPWNIHFTWSPCSPLPMKIIKFEPWPIILLKFRTKLQRKFEMFFFLNFCIFEQRYMEAAPDAPWKLGGTSNSKNCVPNKECPDKENTSQVLTKQLRKWNKQERKHFRYKDEINQSSCRTRPGFQCDGTLIKVRGHTGEERHPVVPHDSFWPLAFCNFGT